MFSTEVFVYIMLYLFIRNFIYIYVGWAICTPKHLQLKLKKLVSGFYKIRHHVDEGNKSTDFYCSIVLPPFGTKFGLIPCQVIPNGGSTKY